MCEHNGIIRTYGDSKYCDLCGIVLGKSFVSATPTFNKDGTNDIGFGATQHELNLSKYLYNRIIEIENEFRKLNIPNETITVAKDFIIKLAQQKYSLKTGENMKILMLNVLHYAKDTKFSFENGRFCKTMNELKDILGIETGREVGKKINKIFKTYNEGARLSKIQLYEPYCPSLMEIVFAYLETFFGIKFELINSDMNLRLSKKLYSKFPSCPQDVMVYILICIISEKLFKKKLYSENEKKIINAKILKYYKINKISIKLDEKIQKKMIKILDNTIIIED